VAYPLAYRQRCDVEFQKLGAVGLTVLVSAGDAGSTNIGHGSSTCSPLQPQYPSSSPFITAVSATYFTPGQTAICYNDVFGLSVPCSVDNLGEVAVAANNGMDWTTGGGFSVSEQRPSYQANVVNGYLKNFPSALPPASTFNSSNRAYPDVSANGHNLLVMLGGEVDIADGTSASSPIFAGTLSLINDYLLSKSNGKPIGFANPLLYSVAASTIGSFFDVTYGDNNCGDVLHPPYVACCPNGYSTTLGWDAVTGLGSPRFPSLFQGILNAIGA